MRLAQGCYRLARTALQQGSQWLAPLRLVGVKMPRVCHTRRAWRRTLLIETEGAAGAAEQGCHTRMRAKPDCDRVPVKRGRDRTAAGATWLDAVRTLTTGLRVSPSLAAAGFQEMRPALALDIASKGDAIAGISRADTASVENYSMFGNLLHDGKRYSAYSANRQTRRCDPRTIKQVPRKPTRGARQFLAGRSAWMV